MTFLIHLKTQCIASALVLALLLNPLFYAIAQAPTPATGSDPQSQTTSAPQSTPDTNSAPATQPAEEQWPNSPGAVQAQPAPATSQTSQTQNAQPQSPNRTREPVGTAAAETVPTTGVAASRPAGSALAPAKQRRIRSILIRTGALVGAAAAIGVTMALSQSSPSRPPGAR